MGTIDLDRFFAKAQGSEDPTRIFPFDIFISHRHFDDPEALIGLLESEGLRVAWDLGLDLRDRRIVEALSHAISQSRSLALFVTDGYSDSIWCRAEYLRAIAVQSQTGIPAVLSLLASPRATDRVPTELRDGETALISDMASLTAIAQQLRDRNNPLLGLPNPNTTQPDGWLRLDYDLLPRTERLLLLHEVLAFWIDNPNGITNGALENERAWNLSSLLGDQISELETSFREATSILRNQPEYDPNSELTEREWERFVDLAELAPIAAERPELSDYWNSNEKWIWDFLLKPLLGAVPHPSVSSRARDAYERVCKCIRTPEIKLEVPLYLDVLREVAGGAPTDDPYWISVKVRLYSASRAS